MLLDISGFTKARIMNTTTISVVVPVYNSAKSLPLLTERLQKVLHTCANEFEIILVNDGSRDASWTVIIQLLSSTPHLNAINLIRNYGQHNALLAEIRAEK